MKTRIILFLMLIMSVKSFAQDKKDEQMIIYDFAKGDYEKSDIKPKRGKPVSLKIKNINPFFYEINIKSEDKSISYQNTDLDFAKKTLDEIQQNNYYKMQESFVFAEENVTFLATDKISTNKIETLNAKYLEIEESQLIINDLVEKSEKIEKKINEINSNADNKNGKEELIKELKKKNDSILLFKKNILKEKNEINKIVSKSEDENLIKGNINKRIEILNTVYNKYINVAREIIKLNQNYNNYIDKVISPELTYSMYDKILTNQEINNYIKKCKEKKESQKLCDSLYTKVLPIESTFFLSKENLDYAYGVFKVYPKFYQSVISETNDFISFLNYSNVNSLESSDFLKSVLIKDIERIQKSIKIADDVVQKINLSKKLNQIEILDRVFRDEKTFEYVSGPIQGEEDYIEFDVNIKSKRNLTETYSVNNDKSFNYFEYITGGIRFDFSIGTIFDFGTIDKKYTLDSNNIIQRLNNNKYNPTIAGIFHASFRNTSDYAFGFSLGTSFNTDFSFNSIFPGISLLMGKRNKIILTAGTSFRLVDDLKANYSEGMSLTNSLADEDLLTKNFKIGFFIGISYNLTPKQKDNLKLK